MDSLILMMNRNQLRYYFKDEAVLLEIPSKRHSHMGNTYISFNCYALQSRKKFNKFKRVLMESRESEYGNISDVYGLASRYGVRPTHAHKPTFVDTIAF